MGKLIGIDYENLIGVQVKMLEDILKTANTETVLLVSRELREIMQFALDMGIRQLDSVK